MTEQKRRPRRRGPTSRSSATRPARARPLPPLVLLALAGCGGAGPPPVDGPVSVGTHSLHVRIRGDGAPPVVIDVGLGGRSEEWHAMQDSLAGRTRVVVYDRAGYGASEPGPLPRHAAREADELRALLEAASVDGPYVLVGHSLGGLNAQVFADRYRDDVAGLVLLDPPPLGWLLGDRFPGLRRMAEAMTDDWQRLADRRPDAADPGARAEADFFRMIASEHREMLGGSARQAAAIESFGDLPVTVIASGLPNPAFGDVAREYQEYWAEESRAVAERSRRGEFVLAAGSSHMLHRDAQDRVLAAIRSMLEPSRRR